MPNTKDRRETRTPSILIIGDGGTEKTRFLSQVPGIFIYDTDKGTASIDPERAVEYETFKDAPFGTKVGPSMKEEGIYEWGTAWPAFFKHFNQNVAEALDKGPLPHQAYGVDSLTTLATICMNYVLKEANKNGRATPEVQHWGSQLRLLETVMDQLTALPIPLFVTAHIKRDDNLLMGTTEYLPMVGGQLSGRLGIYFDEVWYTKVEGVGDKRKIIFVTRAEGLYKQAKSRHNVPTGIEAKWELVAPHLRRTA